MTQCKWREAPGAKTYLIYEQQEQQKEKTYVSLKSLIETATTMGQPG